MRIRSAALRWFNAKYKNNEVPVYTSKYYRAEESWSKEPVWWFVIPLDVIQNSGYKHICLICQNNSNANEFHALKVPVKHLSDNLKRFVLIKDKISIYLSAVPSTLYQETRGTSSLPFRQFVIE